MLRPVDDGIGLQIQLKLTGEERSDRGQVVLEFGRRIRPEDAVVHVANIAANAQTFLDEAIEPAQVEVGEVLRGQAADRQPTPRRRFRSPR